MANRLEIDKVRDCRRHARVGNGNIVEHRVAIFFPLAQQLGALAGQARSFLDLWHGDFAAIPRLMLDLKGTPHDHRHHGSARWRRLHTLSPHIKTIWIAVARIRQRLRELAPSIKAGRRGHGGRLDSYPIN